MNLRRDTVAAMRDRDVSISLWEGFGVQPNADARGIKTTIEIGTGSLPDLPVALAVVGHVVRLSFRLLIDTLHFFRIGGTVADIAALDSNIIGYVQLCDAPLVVSIQVGVGKFYKKDLQRPASVVGDAQ